MAVGQPENPQKPSDGVITVEHGQQSATHDGAEALWDEERIEKALDTLKEMHIQLRGLRTTIPRLIAPLTTRQSSPEKLFRDFSTSANTAIQEVQQFRRLMNDEQSNKVLEQARKSRVENPSNIKPWKVTEHPDWLSKETDVFRG